MPICRVRSPVSGGRGRSICALRRSRARAARGARPTPTPPDSEAPARVRQALADEPLGHDDREDDDGDDAAGIEQDLHGGEELRVERQKHPGRRDQRQRQPQHRVKQVLAEDDGESRADEHGGEAPEGGDLERHAVPAPAASGFRLPASGQLGLLRRRLHVAQPVAGRPRRLVLEADGVQPILVEQHLAPIGRRTCRTTSS